jgi:hypothetical protein
MLAPWWYSINQLVLNPSSLIASTQALLNVIFGPANHLCRVREIALFTRCRTVRPYRRPARPCHCPQHSASHNLPINAHHYHQPYRCHGHSPCCRTVSNSAPRPAPRDRLMADMVIIPSEGPVQSHVIAPHHRQHRAVLSS